MIVSIMADKTMYVSDSKLVASLAPIIHQQKTKSNQCLFFAHRHFMIRQKIIQVYEDHSQSFSFNALKPITPKKPRVIDLLITDLDTMLGPT